MMDVTEYFSLHITTTHAAVTYLDRLQPNEQFTRYEWQMLAICCILISSKFHESEEHVPALRKLEDITQQAITNETLLSYELWALKKMSWKLNARTPVAFLTSYIKLGYVHLLPLGQALDSAQADELNSTLQSLATKCLIASQFKAVPSSLLAAAILYYARLSAGICPAWMPSMTTLMFHDPTTDPLGLKAIEMLCALEDDLSLWEELCLQLQDSKTAAAAPPAVAYPEDDYDENEVREMCDKLTSMLADMSSPEPAKASKSDDVPSPVSIALNSP